MSQTLRHAASQLDSQIKNVESQVKTAQDRLQVLKLQRDALQPELDKLPKDEPKPASSPAPQKQNRVAQS